MDKISKLEKQILYHKDLYYQGRPEISDIAYDKLEDELRKINPESFALTLVGSKSSGSKKVSHGRRMLSLDKTYSLDELIAWSKGHQLVSIQKIDGVSCSLIYEGGKLKIAKTRGDGETGEDITENCLWIDSIRKNLPLSFTGEIRGEIYCSYTKFSALKIEMVKSGLDEPTSPRNITAGLLGRKDHINLCHFLDFFAFDLDGINFTNEYSKLQNIEKLGFKVPEYNLLGVDQFAGLINETQASMDNGDYQIDGLVFTLNDIQLQNELGETNHHPRYKIAFKFMGDTAETVIREIIWQVSRNGILTPVAVVEPVELSGAKIERVTLHNLGHVERHELKKGDSIEVIRSGEVIPKFLVKKKASDSKFSIPKLCPSCGSTLSKKDIRLICENLNCPGRNREIVLNYVFKTDIYDLSEKRIEELMAKGLVKTIDDLYKISIDDLLTLQKTKDKLATKIFESIQSKKKLSLQVFFSAIGISGIGEAKIQKIIDAGYDSINKILALTVEELVKVESFAEKSATDFLSSVQEKRQLIQQLLDAGVQIESHKAATGNLTGKKFAITGKLNQPRSKIEKFIKENGGRVLSSVSSELDFLVTNEKESTSSKFKLAKQYNIPLLSEEDLFKLVGV